ncbi:MAG: hypothetical protein KIC63_03570 [Clostridium sp.]|nr:hypothetical protein [Clostridium sp.]
MLNYKWIRVLRALFFVALAAMLAVAFTCPPRASEFRRVLPSLMAIGFIILGAVLKAVVFSCLRCGSRHILVHNIFYYYPNTVFYCPDCGEELRFTPKGGGQE